MLESGDLNPPRAPSCPGREVGMPEGSATYRDILLTVEEGVALLTLNRPQAPDALSRTPVWGGGGWWPRPPRTGPRPLTAPGGTWWAGVWGPRAAPRAQVHAEGV